MEVPAPEVTLTVPTPRPAGRRRAPGRVRRLPDGLPRLGASFVVKSVASLGVLGGAAVALTIPADPAGADAATLAAQTSDPAASLSAVALADRVGVVDRASRSEDRQAPAPAVSAPAAAPRAPEEVGVAGVEAVAKPKPKPKPEPEPAQEPSGGSADAPVAASGGWSGGITGRCGNIGLLPDAMRLCSAVDAAYGPPTIGGRRASADEHGTGQAIDFMIGSAGQGDAIAAYVQQNVGTFNVKYLIWQQRYWAPGEGWSYMEDRGSATANHYDHVHVTTNY